MVVERKDTDQISFDLSNQPEFTSIPESIEHVQVEEERVAQLMKTAFLSGSSERKPSGLPLAELLNGKGD